MPGFQEYYDAKAKIEMRILALEDSYESEALELQRRLFRYMDETTLSKLDMDAAGNIADTPRNWRLVRNMDDAWASYQNRFLNPAFKAIGDDMISITALSQAAFMNILPDVITTIDHMTEARNGILQMLGMTVGQRSGALSFIQGGYLDRLAQGAGMREELKELVRKNITAGSSFRDFYREFRAAIEGSDEINGQMQRYFRTYVYDAFSGVHAAYDNYVARAAKLNFFIYAGTIIKDSRPFCVEHCNRVYNRQDLAAWERQDWAGKNKEVPVVISRGGYNCRHQLNWITDDIAARLQDGSVGQPPREKAKPKPPPPKSKPLSRAKGKQTEGQKLWKKMLDKANQSVPFKEIVIRENLSRADRIEDMWKQLGARLKDLGIKTEEIELADMARVANMEGWGDRELRDVLNGMLEGFARFQGFKVNVRAVSFIEDEWGGWWQSSTSMININWRAYRWNRKSSQWGIQAGKTNKTAHELVASLTPNAVRAATLHEMSHGLQLMDTYSMGMARYEGNIVRRSDLFDYLVAKKYMSAKWLEQHLSTRITQDGRMLIFIYGKRDIIKALVKAGEKAGMRISNYGTKNMAEIFAECHSGIMQGLKYDTALMEVFEEWYAALGL